MNFSTMAQWQKTTIKRDNGEVSDIYNNEYNKKMIQIGYIYRYNENEEKGILVYGYNWDYTANPTKPIKFSKYDCISEVHTGQLVYFELQNEGSATHIEEASLANFKRDVIQEIVSCYELRDLNDCYKITTIRYENLQDCFWNRYYSDLTDLVSDSGDISEHNRLYKIRNRLLYDEELPESIDELFALFGTKEHYMEFKDNSSICIDILNMDEWFDSEAVKRGHYYGVTVKEILDLFDLFVKKRRVACEKSNNRRMIDDSVSPKWKLLIASLPDEDLRLICKKASMLQPVLPSKFCLDNLDVLSISFGFPDVAVCEAYYRYKIDAINTTTEYRYMSKKILAATYCAAKHDENEGVPACKMGKNVLQKLKDLLENQYQAVILDDVKQKLSLLSGNITYGEQKVLSLLTQGDFKYLEKLGNYIDAYNGITYYEDCVRLHYDCNCFYNIDHVFVTYNALIDEDKVCLKASIQRKVQVCIQRLADEKHKRANAYKVCCIIKKYPQYITHEDIVNIKNAVNSDYAKLDKLDDLNDVAKCCLITSEQHLARFKEITKDFDIKELLGIIERNYDKNIPVLTQAYLIREIIRKFDFKSLETFNCVKTEYGFICNLIGLIKWFNDKSEFEYLDSRAWAEILKETTDKLSKEDRWQLFEQGLISSPSMDNIREHLDNAYYQNNLKDEYFQKDCFQEAMVEDILSDTYCNKVFLILKTLNSQCYNMIRQSGNERVIFFLWAYLLDENINWKSTSQFFYLLPNDIQIKVFKYIFYLNATGHERFTAYELHQKLTNNGKQFLSMTLHVILYLLETKVNDLEARIKLKDLRNAYKIDIINPAIQQDMKMMSFVNEIKEFFYVCHGHLLLSNNYENINYIGEIVKKQTSTGDVFVISFYKFLVDESGCSLDYYDNDYKYISSAIQALSLNIPFVFDNGSYLVSTDYLLEIKEFVIKYKIIDKCNLFNDETPASLYSKYRVQCSDACCDICKINKMCRDVDPLCGIPFYWCNKQPCTRTGNFFNPADQWESYKFADLLNILCNNERNVQDKIWEAQSEIANFINNFLSKSIDDIIKDYHTNVEETIQSTTLKIENEIGVWTDSMSIVTDYKDFDDEEDYDDYRDNSDYEEQTYDRYAGSYAQDEMGYSDDDIDTIFDGDPDAYWNID